MDGGDNKNHKANRRLFFPGDLSCNDVLTLNDTQNHYVQHVLRMRVGASLKVFNGEGGEYHAVITTLSRHNTKIRLEAFDDITRESPLKVHLAQGISRPSHMDFALQKAVELGVSEISPIITARTGHFFTAKHVDKRLVHWEQIIIHALQQSGRTGYPRLNAPIGVSEWLKNSDPLPQARYLLSPTASTRFHSLPKPASSLVLLVGAEGGFLDEECQLARAHHFQEISLGPRILRTETATLSALTLAQGLWGDL